MRSETGCAEWLRKIPSHGSFSHSGVLCRTPCRTPVGRSWPAPGAAALPHRSTRPSRRSAHSCHTVSCRSPKGVACCHNLSCPRATLSARDDRAVAPPAFSPLHIGPRLSQLRGGPQIYVYSDLRRSVCQHSTVIYHGTDWSLVGPFRCLPCLASYPIAPPVAWLSGSRIIAANLFRGVTVVPGWSGGLPRCISGALVLHPWSDNSRGYHACGSISIIRVSRPMNRRCCPYANDHLRPMAWVSTCSHRDWWWFCTVRDC